MGGVALSTERAPLLSPLSEYVAATDTDRLDPNAPRALIALGSIVPSEYAALAIPAARRDTEELLPGPGLSKSIPCLLKK